MEKILLDEHAQKALFRYLRLTIEQQQGTLRGILSTLSDYEKGLVSKPRTKDQVLNSKEFYHD